MLKSIQAKTRLVELGKIKIGRKKAEEREAKGGSKWRMPEKLDHFLITTLRRDSKQDLIVDTALMDELLKAQGGGEKLTRIPIEVPSDEIDEIIQASWCYYGSRKLWATCDEENCTWFLDQEGTPLAKPIVRACNGEHLVKPPKGKPGWKVHAVFNCMIKAGPGSVLGGVYKLRTTSQISLDQLYSSLVAIKARMLVLEGIPLQLVLDPREVAPDGQSTTVYVVRVELRAEDLVKQQQQAAQLAEFRARNAKQIEAARIEYRRLLKAPGQDESPEEQGEVAEEFQPESVDAELVTAAPDPVITSSSAAPSLPPTNPYPPPPVDEDPARTAPAPVSELNAEAAYDAAREAAPQDRQVEQAPAPVAPAAPELTEAVRKVLAMIESAKTSQELAAAHKAGKSLSAPEKKQISKAYNAKYTQIVSANGASHV